MNYAIIAAGEGSRLRKEGFQNVKPLVRINGEYLIERLIRIFKDNDAESISIIINEESTELKSYLDSKDWQVKINLIVKSTPSSLHSFWNIIKQTDIKQCCLTTVDTIFNERDFKEYISCFQSCKEVDALMGVTQYIDDEKPLYVKTDGDNNILAFCDNKDGVTDNIVCDGDFQSPSGCINNIDASDTVSAGIYCLREKAIEKADDCINKGVSRMRNYQRSLVEANLRVKAFLFSKVIDIDHVEDIQKAEKLLKQFNTKVLCVKRFKDYSPNSQDKDAKIINAVGENLRKEGFEVDYKEETQIDFSKDYYPYVISMARSPEVIEKLGQWENKGSVVINSSASCLNCWRERQIQILQSNNISIPSTIILSTDNDIESLKTNTVLKEFNTKGKEWWIKRGDFQTVQAIDVVKVSSVEKTAEILNSYKSRGIKTAVICENINGDIVKFYGVTGTDFFYYTYPSKDKFNNPVNVSNQRIQINEEDFITLCKKAADCLDLDIYGGDAAIDKDGKFYIIDMNDFPSFSSCTNEAASSIVKRFSDKYNL